MQQILLFVLNGLAYKKVLVSLRQNGFMRSLLGVYGFELCGICSKLVCLSKTMKVDSKYTTLLSNLSVTNL